MTVQEALRDAAKRLAPRHITCAADKHLGRLEAEILLAFTLQKPKEWLLAHTECAVSSAQWVKFQRLIHRREKHMPIAYIVGEKEFYGLPFKVTRDVLIPRPETELLVELALSHLPSPSFVRRGLDKKSPPYEGGVEGVNWARDGMSIWDVGTGSGAVAIAIAKKLPKARVIASDVSHDALAIAKQNARLNGVKNVTFFKADLLDATARKTISALPTHFVIVANLPYLPASDKKKLAPDVVKYEPNRALFVGKTGMELNEKFLRQLAAFDLHFTSAFLEFDPPQSKKLRALTKELFPHARIKVHRDLARRERVLEITS